MQDQPNKPQGLGVAPESSPVCPRCGGRLTWGRRAGVVAHHCLGASCGYAMGKYAHVGVRRLVAVREAEREAALGYAQRIGEMAERVRRELEGPGLHMPQVGLGKGGGGSDGMEWDGGGLAESQPLPVPVAHRADGAGVEGGLGDGDGGWLDMDLTGQSPIFLPRSGKLGESDEGGAGGSTQGATDVAPAPTAPTDGDLDGSDFLF